MIARQHTAQRHFVGVIHLLPLPGAPRGGDLASATTRALHDAEALACGGADAVIVENLGDAPFAAHTVEPITVACMTAIAGQIAQRFPALELGINVLRNDVRAALGIAHVVGAGFIRANVWTGVMATDQGLIEGVAREILRDRRALNADRVAVLADVLVKHATPLGALRLDDAARDTWHRAGADGLIVSGQGTGRPTSADDLMLVRHAVPDAPLFVGSGFTPDTAAALRPHLDGAIVGTYLHHDGQLHTPLDLDRVRAVRQLLS